MVPHIFCANLCSLIYVHAVLIHLGNRINYYNLNLVLKNCQVLNNKFRCPNKSDLKL